MGGQLAAQSGGWLFGLSFFNTLLVLGLCVLLPVVVYKFYIANSSLRYPSGSSRSSHVIVDSVHYPYGVEEIQGKRNYMEDRHVEAGNLGGNSRASFYGVFDGHGGSRASEFCVAHMVPNLLASPHFHTNPHKALVNAFMQTDKQFLEIARRNKHDDGTTACAALVLENRLIVANAGDTRAVVVQRQGKVVPMSMDHKPHRIDEKDRIRKLGGSVFLVGVWRVEGILAVSRAIGDRVLKRYVTAQPDIKERRVSAHDRFLVIASDGLWDVMSNEEVGDMIYKISKPEQAAAVLVQCAYSRGSTDNITALVVDLLHPKPSHTSAASSGASGAGAGVSASAGLNLSSVLPNMKGHAHGMKNA